MKIGLLSLSVVFIIGLGVTKIVLQNGNPLPVAKEAFVLATTVKPETFTELYFEDHLNLPKIITSHGNYNFTFTLHNLENRDMEYPYVVYLETADKKIILEQGVIGLNDGGYQSVKEDFGPLKPVRMKITVELVNKNQKISFWMEKGESPQ